jgi:hypothetical protein
MTDAPDDDRPGGPHEPPDEGRQRRTTATVDSDAEDRANEELPLDPAGPTEFGEAIDG